MPKADLQHYFDQRLHRCVETSLTTLRGQSVLIVGQPYQRLSTADHFLHHFVLAPGSKVDVQADFEEIPFSSGDFDVIIVWQVLDRIPHYFHVMHELARVLKPGGKMVLANVSAFRADMHAWLRQDAQQINTLSQLVLVADQCHLAVERVERVGLFARSHAWLDRLENLCLPYAGGLSLGYIAVFDRREAGLVPLAIEWTKQRAAILG